MTRRTKPIVLLLSLLLAGCGEQTIEADFSTAVEWPYATAVCEDESNLTQMDAELWIGGHEPCDLTVDDNTFAAAGPCPDILPGVDRPLVIYYFLENASGPDHALLFCVGYVDLRPESLPADTDGNLDITLCDGDGSLMIYEDAFMAELPEYDQEETDPAIRAKMYTREIYYRQIDGALDSDGDGCPNLVEACNGTLDTVGNTDC